MADAGTIYYNALSGMGNDIARGMMYYHQQHVQYDQQRQLADALSRIGISPQGSIVPIQQDEKGNPVDKTIRPIIDPKSLELFQARNQRERVAAIGGLNALNRLGTQLIGKAMTQALSDQGLTGQLKQQRIQQSQSRTELNQAQLGKVLGLIPPTQPMPTGGQVLAEQRSLRKERFSQRKAIADNLLTQKVVDPEMLLGGVRFQMPKSGFHIQEGPIVDGAVDKNGNIVPPPDATHAVLDDGTKIPLPQFKRLYPQAQQWKNLGTNLPSIKAPPPHDIQMLLADPTDQKKALFDQVYGNGAADLVISAQGKAATQQPAAQTQPDTESPDEYDTSGEDETPPPSDAGGE
jgi:sulfur carrier protein ThiS